MRSIAAAALAAIIVTAVAFGAATIIYAGGAAATGEVVNSSGGALSVDSTERLAMPPAAASVSFGAAGYGCVDGVLRISKADIARDLGRSITDGWRLATFNNVAGFSKSGFHADALCDECTAHGSRFGRGGAFCRVLMKDVGDAYVLNVDPRDFEGVADGTEVRWGFQGDGAAYYPTPGMRNLPHVYADIIVMNGQSFKAPLRRSSGDRAAR